MDQIHRDALRRTRVALVKDLDVNIVCDELLSQDIFTPLMIEHIMVEGTRNDKVCRLLNTLVEIGTNAYQAFLNVLQTTGYEFLANQIVQNEEMIRRENPFISTPIQETNQPAEEIHPSPIPFELRNYTSAGQSSFVGTQIQNSNSSSLEASGSSTIIYSRTSEFSLPPSCRHVHEAVLGLWFTCISMLEQRENTAFSYSWPYCSCCKTHIFQRYTMDSDPRGAVLIINNRRFANNHKERLGTEQDCRNLKLLFEELGFHVYVKEDLRSFEILRDCKDFAKDPILAKVDCMVLAVLSHGTADNVICGADAKMINVMDEICPIFSPLRCPYLSGKPKMYIFNACRGDSFYLPNEVGGYRSQVLENQDILFCYSTFPGYASYRDPDRGSWFVQEFVEVFREQANEEHVIDMLTEVNKRVSQKNHTDNSLEASCVQIPCPATSLTKKWYLNPLGAISLGH
uniref:Caspase-2 n=1 Tax=Magallana gigas TaxID=29159 RepID=A0A8W8JXW5_MAGGI